jgi:hypothetical protein
MAEKAMILLAVGLPAGVAGFSGRIGQRIDNGLGRLWPGLPAGGVGGRGLGTGGGLIQLCLARG